MMIENFVKYVSPEDLIRFSFIFTILFVSFSYTTVDIKSTLLASVVMYIIYHWHIYARKKTFDSIDGELETLIDAQIPMKSIMEVKNVKFILILSKLLPYKEYNEYQFSNGVTHIDNFLRLYLDVAKRNVVYSAHHTEQAEMEKTKALNSFMSIMSAIPSYTNNDLASKQTILQNPLDLSLYRLIHELEYLMDQYLVQMAKVSNETWETNKNTETKPVYLLSPKPTDHDHYKQYEVY